MAEPFTLLAVHAHPDDESSSTGGVLARYGAEGVRTVVVTCTNGELGDGPGGVKPGELGHDEAAVAATRLAELEEACRILGIDALERLGYHDSGMADWEYKDRPDAFCNIPLDESVGRVSELLEKYRPQVVITYDDFGGYNHPDHVQAHRVTVEAVDRTGIPAKLYFTARRFRDFERVRERMRELGIDIGAGPNVDPERRRRMEAMAERITTEVDISAVIDLKRRALTAHASQIAESWFAKMPEDLFDDVFGVETFVRALDRTGTAIPEDDLFVGLR